MPTYNSILCSGHFDAFVHCIAISMSNILVLVNAFSAFVQKPGSTQSFVLSEAEYVNINRTMNIELIFQT